MSVEDRPVPVTSVHGDCRIIVPCKLPETTIQSDAEEFMQDFSSAVVDQILNGVKTDCDCLKAKYQAEFGPELDRKKNEERVRINKTILEAYQRKFINDFSLNLEETSFFITKSGDMFEDEEKAKELQCNDTKRYDEFIEASCRSRNITDQEFINKRKKLFLNNQTADFEQALEALSYDVQAISYEKDGADHLFTRFEYDNGRIGLAHQSREAQVIDHIISSILKNNQLKAMIRVTMDQSTPVVSILQIFERFKDNPEIMKNFDHNLIGDYDNIKRSFRFLMNTHPGFLNLMEDDLVFQYFEEQYVPNTSVLKTLETNQKILDPVISSRCNRIMQEFAEAVCTKDEDLMGKMNPDDLELLLHAQSESSSDQLHELLVCENKKTTPTFGNFEKLANLYDNRLPSRKSDYLERFLEKDLNKHKNLFTRTMLANKNKEFRDGMAKAAEAGAKIAKSVSAGGIVSSKVYAKAAVEGKAFSFGKPAMSREEAKSYLKKNVEYEKSYQKNKQISAQNKNKEKSDKEEVVSKPQKENIRQRNVNNNMAVNPDTTVSTGVARQGLQNFLNREHKQEEVKKVVSDLDDRSVQELNRLRNENQSLLQRNYELEQRRLDLMQSRIEELSRQINSPVPQTSVKGQSKVTNVKAEVANEVPVSPGTIVSPRPVPSISPVRPAEDKAGLGAPTAAVQTTINPVSARSNVESTSGPITTANLDIIDQEKINTEVEEFFEHSILSEEMIEEIITKGVRIQFQIMENNQLVDKEMIIPFESLNQRLKDVVELKKYEKQREQQISKLNALKMLMSSSLRR